MCNAMWHVIAEWLSFFPFLCVYIESLSCVRGGNSRRKIPNVGAMLVFSFCQTEIFYDVWRSTACIRTPLSEHHCVMIHSLEKNAHNSPIDVKYIHLKFVVNSYLNSRVHSVILGESLKRQFTTARRRSTVFIRRYMLLSLCVACWWVTFISFVP